MATLADISPDQFTRFNDETGTDSFNRMGYNAALRDIGYITTDSPVGGYWKDQNTLNWFNNSYGTNFQSPEQYMEYLYGPGGKMINDPTHGNLWYLGEGKSGNEFINKPLSYEKSDWFDTAIPGLIGLMATAGMTGMLPGTESVFAAPGAGAGVYGGEIAGTSIAAEGAAAGGLGAGAPLASEAGFLPGSFELGASGYGGTAAAGLDAAAVEALTGMSGLVGGLPLTQAAAPVGSLTSPGFLPGTTNFGTGVLSSGATTGFTGGGIMDELLKLLQKSGMGPGGTVSNLMNIGSGLYGMYESSQMRKLAQQAMQVQDPFGSQRPQYAQMLSQLYADPSRITKMPGYEAGLDAVERRMASQGYLGSGNMMAALQKYGGDFFNAEAARLAQLAGAGFGPSGAGQSLLQGNQNANELLSRALASIGYGVRGMFPGSNTPGIIWN